MKLNFRQGVYRRKPDALQFGIVSGYVSIVVDSTESLIASVASGPTKNYLIQEARTVNQAWGPFSGTDTQHLYWEINELSGDVSRGATTLSLVIGASEPPSPAPGQMWWDTSVTKMKVWDGTRWREKLRVMAGTLNSGTILNPAPLGSQVGITNPNPVYEAGFILTDGFGKAFRNAANEFFTTATLVGSPDTGSLVKLEGSQVIAPANEPMPAFSLVCFIAGGRVALATGLPPNNVERAPVGIITVPAASGDLVQVETGTRVISADEWNWDSADIGKPLYCSSSGQLTLNPPTSTKNVRVATILSSKSILLSFDWQTNLPDASNSLTGLNVNAPLTKTGSAIFPTLAIPRATDAVDGFIHKDDMARITAVENELPNKSDVGHTHTIPDVFGLQAALDDKASIVHTHAIGDVDDLSATLTFIDVQINAKADKVIGAAAGNLASLDASGNLLDSGYDAGDFAAAAHTHAITDVTGLQAALDDKTDVGHTHVAADVTDLQPLLDDKADFVHTHVAADVTDLQPLLDGKTDVGHAHLISDVTSLQITLDAKSNVGHGHVIADVTGLQAALDDKADVNHTQPISSVTGLQTALDGKSDVGHGHVIADVTGLQLALDSKSDVGHGHSIADVTGLQAVLDSKADTSHTHVIADVTGLQLALDGKANALHMHTLAGSLNDVDLVNFPPSNGHVLTFNGALWVSAAPSSGGYTAPESEIVFGGASGNTSSDNLYYDIANKTLVVNANADDGTGGIEIYSGKNGSNQGEAGLVFYSPGVGGASQVYLYSGTSNGLGAQLEIAAGSGIDSSGGGSLYLYSGSGGTSGSINIRTGSADQGASGSIDIEVQSGIISGGDVYLKSGNASLGPGGDINIDAGNSSDFDGDSNGGSIFIKAGDTVSSALGEGGEINLSAGVNFGNPAQSGAIALQTNNTVRLLINPDGSFEVGGSVGTSGQVLTSNGPSSPPTWEDPSILMTINAQTASYTAQLEDGDGKTLVRMNSASALNFTVPANSSVDFPIGTILLVSQAGTGQVTIVPDSGVTINSPETLNIRKQHGKVTLIKVGTDEWDIEGNLEPV